MASISKSLRSKVIERAKGCCEYCQTQQSVVIEMEIDHIKPEVKGGKTVFENLCLACISCNMHKRAYEVGIDPSTGHTEPLFNPRIQIWEEHFRWSDDQIQIVGLTPIGHATVHRLKMNAMIVMTARRKWVQAGWHPPRH